MKLLSEQRFLCLGKLEQHAYLLRVRQRIRQGRACNCPHWLYFVMLAYFTGNTSEIEGTATMSTYRDVLLNQVLP